MEQRLSAGIPQDLTILHLVIMLDPISSPETTILSSVPIPISRAQHDPISSI
jgi:hypothetical protein